MLQTPDMDGLLRADASLGERAGVVSLVLVLFEEMERRQRSGVFALAQNLSKKNQGRGKELDTKDVNKLFGWAIHSVRQLKQNESFQVRQAGGDRTQLEREIQFLKSMVWRKKGTAGQRPL